MGNPKSKKSLLKSLQEEQSSTNDAVELARNLDQMVSKYENLLKDSDAGIGFRTRFSSGLQSLRDAVIGELGYMGLWVIKILLMIVCNAAAVLLIFWAISLI